MKQEQQSAVAAAEQHLASELDAKREEQLATAEQVAPMVLGEQFNSDLSAHIDDELSVPVFLDHDGHYGRVRVDGKVEELPVSEISRRWPNYRVVTHREFYGAFPTKADLEKCSLPQGFSLLA